MDQTMQYVVDRRYELSEILRGLLVEVIGKENATYRDEEGKLKYKVYFQPGENIIIQYPCIIYERKTGDTQFADNKPYIFMRQYSVTVVDKNPDSRIPDRIALLPLCKSDRDYIAKNLNHYAFNLYY